jgi:hypothetical protein
VAFDPGGRLAAGDGSGVVRVWDLDRPADAPVTLRSPVEVGESHVIRTVALGPGGRLAACDGSGAVRVWDLDRPDAEPVTLRGGMIYLDTVALGPGGRLAAGDGGGEVRVWDLDHPADAPVILRGGKDYVIAVALGPGGWLASGDIRGVVRVWDLDRSADAPVTLQVGTDQVLGTDRVRAVAFGADGRSLFLATSWWFHVARVDGTALSPRTSRPFPFIFTHGPTAVRFLDPSGDRVEVAVLPTRDSILPTTLRLDTFDADPIPGHPVTLLEDWQKRLALEISGNGTIVIKNVPMGEP